MPSRRFDDPIDLKPFRWTKSADDILASIERFCCRTISQEKS
jgi:hypothetical protein